MTVSADGLLFQSSTALTAGLDYYRANLVAALGQAFGWSTKS